MNDKVRFDCGCEGTLTNALTGHMHLEPCQLHAAAPDLLAACKAALKTIDKLTDWPAMPDDFYLPTARLLASVIAKVEGA